MNAKVFKNDIIRKQSEELSELRKVVETLKSGIKKLQKIIQGERRLTILIDLIRKEDFNTNKTAAMQYISNQGWHDTTETNTEFDLKKGDVIVFTGGEHGTVHFVSEVLAFDNKGWAFVVWDCWWVTINLHERFVCKIINEGELV